MSHPTHQTNLWETVKCDLKGLFPDDVFQMWFEPMRCVESSEDAVTLGVPNDFAAIVLVAGGGVDEFACTLKHIPVWLIHNQADNVVPPSESIELHEAIQACSGLSRLTLNTSLPPGAHPHDAWSATYGSRGFYDWLLRHRLGIPGPLF